MFTHLMTAEQKVEFALKMVVLDAFAKNPTATIEQMIAYSQTAVCASAVQNYLTLLNT